MFKVLILFSVVTFSFGDKQSINECLYVVHQAENELLAVLAVGYIHEGQEDAAILIIRNIYEYPNEAGTYKDFMQKTAQKISKIEDKDKAKSYILKLVKEKEKNFRYLQKKCKEL